LVARQYGKILDFVVAVATAVGTIVAYEGAVAQEEEIRIRVEEGAASVAAETVDVPSVTSCEIESTE
jgi:hypothetical protein